MSTVDNLVTQIGITNAAIKRQFSTDPAINVSLITEFAGWLAGQGVENVNDLTHFEDAAAGVSFFYDMRTGRVIDSPTGQLYVDWTTGGFRNSSLIHEMGRDSRFNYYVYLKFTKDGFPVFITAGEDNGSDWTDVRKGVIFIASVVLSVAYPALGQTIGQAMFGASVPASVATAVGNVAVSTALNGGDVQAAVVSAVSGGIGGVTGGFVTTATGAQWIGNAAAAATSALVRGGDPAFSVAGSLINSGVNSMDDILFPDADMVDMSDGSYFNADGDPLATDPQQYTFGGDISPGYGQASYYTDSNGISYGYDANGDLMVLDSVDSNGIGYFTDADGDVQVADTSPAPVQTSPVSQLPAPASVSAPTNYAALISAGLSLVKAYQNASNPAVRTYSSTTQAKANGTVTRVVNGQVVSTKPPVGVPYQTASGAVITNNGDGTYTTISPTGQSTVSRYGSIGGLTAGVSPTMLAVGAAAVGVLLLVRR